MPKARRQGKPANHTEKLTGEQSSNDSEASIENYLNHFKEIIERSDPVKKERGINALKKVLSDRYVVKVEDIPESYWQAQMRIMRDRNQIGGWQNLSAEEQLKIKQEHFANIKEDQKGSLEEWIDYLASEKSSYLPDYLKYWAFAGMLRLERYEKGDKEKGVPGRFPKRPTGKQKSVKIFPEVNERGLKFISSAYKAQAGGQPVDFRYDIPKSAHQSFLAGLAKKDFQTLYSWTQKYLPPISEEEMQNTQGEWIVYKQDSDARVLSKSLQGKGSGWCIAGEGVTSQYLKKGSLHIYYTRDREKKLTIPRVAIDEQGNRVTEVRGIEWEENIDNYIAATNIIGDKLKKLPGGGAFEQTEKDTKLLTFIDKKMSTKQNLTREELIFLYEIDRPILYFGHKRDPQIDEIRKCRNSKEDAPIIFECEPDEVAYGEKNVKENTKVYIGKFFKKIFQKDFEHIYTGFPEGKIRKMKAEIGGKSKEDLIGELKNNFRVSKTAEEMLKSTDFTVLEDKEQIDLVKLTVRDLGFPKGATTDEIYEKAKELGLELCPAETGPYLRLQYKDQPMNEYLRIGMKQITDTSGDPNIFGVYRRSDGAWLNDYWANPTDEWLPGHEFVFRFRKLET